MWRPRRRLRCRRRGQSSGPADPIESIRSSRSKRSGALLRVFFLFPWVSLTIYHLCIHVYRYYSCIYYRSYTDIHPASPNDVHAIYHPRFESAYYFSVPVEVEQEELRLTALDALGSAKGSTAVRLAELLQRGALRVERLGELAAKVKVCIYGLWRGVEVKRIRKRG